MESPALEPVVQANGHPAQHRSALHCLVDMLPDVIVLSTLRVLLVMLGLSCDSPPCGPPGSP